MTVMNSIPTSAVFPITFAFSGYQYFITFQFIIIKYIRITVTNITLLCNINETYCKFNASTKKVRLIIVTEFSKRFYHDEIKKRSKLRILWKLFACNFRIYLVKGKTAYTRSHGKSKKSTTRPRTDISELGSARLLVSSWEKFARDSLKCESVFLQSALDFWSRNWFLSKAQKWKLLLIDLAVGRFLAIDL